MRMQPLNRIRSRLFRILFLLFCLTVSSQCALAATTSNDSYYRIYNSMQQDLQYAMSNYENSLPAFDTYVRKPDKPLRPIASPRYKMGSDGIYRSSQKGDHVAVIMCAGDLMCQKNQQRQALKKYGKYVFDDNFTYVKKIFSTADFVVGNLETLLSEQASYFSEQPLVDGVPNCNAPATYLDAVRYAGFDMTVAANNHNCDSGVKGIFQTLAHLDQYKLLHTGLFRNKEEKRYVIAEIDGIKVAFLSYSCLYNKDQHYTKEGKDVLLNKYSSQKAQKDIADAKAAGAEYVITYIHWGIEYENHQSDRQKQIASQLANAGSDYIVGSHPHCLQPYDRIKAADGRTVPVIYSLGNFVSQMKKNPITMESMILKIKLVRNARGKVVLKSDGYIPCKIMPSYKGNNFTCLPLTSSYNSGNTTVTGQAFLKHINKVVGSKLPMLGKVPLSYLKIKLGYTETVYSGYKKTPRVYVYDLKGNLLRKRLDYKVSRVNNVLPGVSKVTVKGLGRYSGSWKGYVTILPKAVRNFSKKRIGQVYELSWKESKGAEAYLIYLKKPGAKGYQLVMQTTDISCILEPEKKAGTYRIRVAAYVNSPKGMLISEKSSSLSYTVK